MPSINFKNHQWLDIKDGLSSNPYDKLSELFEGATIIDAQETDEVIKDGGAAMTAYAKMQFEDMPIDEREGLRNSLLKYCELDTLAMVMIYEAWLDWLK